jgi:hypothetical protein
MLQNATDACSIQVSLEEQMVARASTAGRKARSIRKKRPSDVSISPVERVESAIFVVRGQKVLLDRDLATFYGVGTKVLNQAVRRNLDRFPEDFMFRLTWEEAEALRSQFVTLDEAGEAPDTEGSEKNAEQQPLDQGHKS